MFFFSWLAEGRRSLMHTRLQLPALQQPFCLLTLSRGRFKSFQEGYGATAADALLDEAVVAGR